MGWRSLSSGAHSRDPLALPILRAINVIASAAKQSILSLRGKMDCFVARAPRNDVVGVPIRISNSA
jgi:hypothetical protein